MARENSKNKEENQAPLFKLEVGKTDIKKQQKENIPQVEGLISLNKYNDFISDLIDETQKDIDYHKNQMALSKLEYENKMQEKRNLQLERERIKEQKKENSKLFNAINKKDSTISKINTPNNRVIKNLSTNEEPLIKKKQEAIIKKEREKELKNEYRANLFYSNMDTDKEAKEYFEKKKEQELKKQQIGLQNVSSHKALPIADVEKTLFQNGNIAEMSFENSKKLGESLKQKEKKSKEFEFALNEEIIKNFYTHLSVLHNVIYSAKLNEDEINIILDAIKRVLKNKKKIWNLNYDTEEVNNYLNKKHTDADNYLLKVLLLWINTNNKLDEFYKRPNINITDDTQYEIDIKNSMRHIVGLARATRIFGLEEALRIGDYKENSDKIREFADTIFSIGNDLGDANILDFKKIKNNFIELKKDTKIDYENNLIGINYILEHPNATDEEIINFAYEYSIKNVKK